MARSVVLRPTTKCPRCQVALRWCVCAGLRRIESKVAVEVLIHTRESHRPSSTGHLLGRVLAETRLHLYHRERIPTLASVQRPGRTLWVLHPLGEAVTMNELPPESLQLLLLDGSWGEAAEMKRSVESWGRRVSLPMEGESRYWLRAQQGPRQYSTAEALIFLLRALGETATADALALQLELHVYAGLLSRGRKVEAANYLLHSPLPRALPEVLRQLAPQ